MDSCLWFDVKEWIGARLTGPVKVELEFNKAQQQPPGLGYRIQEDWE